MVSHGDKKPSAPKAGRGKKSKRVVATASHPEQAATEGPAPVVVEAGSRSKAALRHLEQGTGPLMREIDQIVQAVHAAMPKPVPLVVVYREKRSSNSRSASPFELFF